MEFGGNTTCVRVTLSHGFIIIFDAGTGIRQLGKDLIASAHEQFDFIPIVLSHTHGDHAQGFPFFGPADDPRRNSRIAIGGGSAGGGWACRRVRFQILAVVDTLTRLSSEMRFAGERAEFDAKAGQLLALVA